MGLLPWFYSSVFFASKNESVNAKFMNRNIELIPPYIPSPRGADDVRFKLDWNEGFADTRRIVTEVLSSLNSDCTVLSQYADPAYSDLCLAASRFYLPHDQSVMLLPFAGSDAAIAAVATAFVSSDDTVVVPAPSYDNARLEFQIRTPRVERYRIDKDNPLELSNLIEFCSSVAAALVYLANPCNPTGYFINQQAVAKMAASMPSTLFLIDEAYIEFSGAESAIPLIAEYPNILVTRTMSKAFSLASLRVGFLFGSRSNISLVDKVRNSKAISFISAAIAAQALRRPSYMLEYVARVKMQRDALERRLQGVGVPFIKSFGNFVIFRDLDGRLGRQLRDHGVLYRDRSNDFGEAGWIRLTLCPNVALEEMVGG